MLENKLMLATECTMGLWGYGNIKKNNIITKNKNNTLDVIQINMNSGGIFEF